MSILDAEGAVVFETAGFEKKLSPDQNHSEVVPPFNAFAPAGDVQVRGFTYWVGAFADNAYA